jgi:hypothetical protein
MFMSPYSDLDQGYFGFTLNHSVSPSYGPGGMQVLQYSGNEIVSYRDGVHSSTLSSYGDVVRWRQRMTASSGMITFEIEQGTSATWGEFGGQGFLKEVMSSGPSNLDQYRPRLSPIESSINFAGNRVASLRLMKLEYFLSDGRTVTFEAPIDIDGDLDPLD